MGPEIGRAIHDESVLAMLRTPWHVAPCSARRSLQTTNVFTSKRKLFPKRWPLVMVRGWESGRSYSNANAAIGGTNPSFRVFRCPFEKTVPDRARPQKSLSIDCRDSEGVNISVLSVTMRPTRAGERSRSRPALSRSHRTLSWILFKPRGRALRLKSGRMRLSVDSSAHPP